MQLANIPTTTSQYASFLATDTDGRKNLLKTFTGTSTTTGDFKKGTAKILQAMITSKDCEESKLRETAEKITGVDIREIFQGVYELRVVFAAVVANQIELTEDEFDSIGSSILALLSPFIQKDELKPLLPQAVALAKSGTAKEIRDLKPKKEPTEPKAVKEQREKTEAAEKKAVEAEERAAAAEKRAAEIESRYTVECQFAITDLPNGGPVMKSDQLRNRIRQDLRNADEESALFHRDKFLKGYVGICQQLGLDPMAGLTDLMAELATATTGTTTDTAAASTAGVIEVEAQAA
jgi:hypothetical protein